MRLQRGDHICALYSTTSELIEMVSDYLVDGLQRGQRCWHVSATHPIVRAGGSYVGTEFYDASVTALSTVDEMTVLKKLEKVAN